MTYVQTRLPLSGCWLGGAINPLPRFELQHFRLSPFGGPSSGLKLTVTELAVSFLARIAMTLQKTRSTRDLSRVETAKLRLPTGKISPSRLRTATGFRLASLRPQRADLAGRHSGPHCVISLGRRVLGSLRIRDPYNFSRSTPCYPYTRPVQHPAGMVCRQIYDTPRLSRSRQRLAFTTVNHGNLKGRH